MEGGTLRSMTEGDKQTEREELMRFRGGQAGGKGPSSSSKGKGKGQGKDQTGEEICYSWAEDQGPCAR